MPYNVYSNNWVNKIYWDTDADFTCSKTDEYVVIEPTAISNDKVFYLPSATDVGIRHTVYLDNSIDNITDYIDVYTLGSYKIDGEDYFRFYNYYKIIAFTYIGGMWVTRGLNNTPLITPGTYQSVLTLDNNDGTNKIYSSNMLYDDTTLKQNATQISNALGGINSYLSNGLFASYNTGNFNGETIDGTAGENINIGNIIYLSEIDGYWYKVTTLRYNRPLGIALIDANTNDTFIILLKGFVWTNSVISPSTSAMVYVSATAGQMVTTPPSSNIRVVGHMYTDLILRFNPDEAVENTINNAGDNRLLTSNSSTDINAESNLTFDGNELKVTGQGVSNLFTNGATSGNVTINWDNGNVQTLTINATVSNLYYTNIIPGGVYTLVLSIGATGSNITNWPTGTLWPNGNTPTLTTTVGAVDIVSVVAIGTASNLYTVINQKF